MESVVAAVAAAVHLVGFRAASYRVASDDDEITNLRLGALLDHRLVALDAIIAARAAIAYDRRPGRHTA
jgi:hypothetical protein